MTLFIRSIRSCLLALAIAVSAALSTLSACAILTTHLPKNPDGSLNVPQLVIYAEEGVRPACDSGWLDPALCKELLDGLDLAKAAAEKDPEHSQAAAATVIEDLEKHLPVDSKGLAFLDWLVRLLRTGLPAEGV